MTKGRTVISAAVLTLVTAANATSAGTDGGEVGSPTWAEVLGTSVTKEWAEEKYRVFDFWRGAWDVNWRPQPEGSFFHDKEGLWTRGAVFPILDGKALLELAWDRDNPDTPSQRGMSVRYLDETTGRWVMSQSWPSQTGDGSGMLDQLTGTGHHGRVSLYSAQRRRQPDGTLKEGVRRYQFSDIRPGISFRWDWSNTYDNGVSWSNFSIAEMARVGDFSVEGQAGTDLPGQHEGQLCKSEPHGALDFLQGNWKGNVAHADGGEAPASLSAGMTLDGCLIAGVLAADGYKTFLTWSFNPFSGYWVTYHLDDRKGTRHRYQVAKSLDSDAIFVEAEEAVIRDQFTHFYRKGLFEELAPLKRTVWLERGPDRVIWREEDRVDTSSAWQHARTVTLARKLE